MRGLPGPQFYMNSKQNKQTQTKTHGGHGSTHPTVLTLEKIRGFKASLGYLRPGHKTTCKGWGITVLQNVEQTDTMVSVLLMQEKDYFVKSRKKRRPANDSVSILLALLFHGLTLLL